MPCASRNARGLLRGGWRLAARAKPAYPGAMNEPAWPPALVRGVVAALIEASRPGERVSVDAIAERLGASAVTQAEIEAIFDALEAQGREVWSPAGGDGAARLREVLRAARALRAEGGAPTPEVIAGALSWPVGEVHRALLFGKILGR